jgi:GT2 family glycosyltransferase
MIDVLVVVYRPDLDDLGAGLAAVAAARDEGLDLRLHLWHNDEGPAATPGLDERYTRLRAAGVPLRVGGARGNLGFGRGVNAMLGDVTAEHVLLLNQDAIPEPGALARLWHTARADAADVAAWEMRQIPYEHPKDYDPVTLDTEWCSGAAVLLRTAALRAEGGFEPRIFMYGEDVDLSWRLRCAGWRLRYLPRCAVVHRTYSTPNEVKPLMVLGSVYANLALRTRFAGRRCVAQGVAMVLRELRGPQPFAGRRAGIAKALARFALHYPYYRRTRRAGPGFEPYFAGWDFEHRREGAFHPFRAAAEQPAVRPLVSLVVRSNGRPGFLRQALATIANQTYRPLEVIVVEDGDDDTSEVCAAFAREVDLRRVRLDPPQGPLAAANRGLADAHGEWLGFVGDDQRLYADHVEVLLQAALDAGASAAYALAWRALTRIVDARRGLFEQPWRDTLPVAPSAPEALPLPAVLFHRRLFERHGGFVAGDEAPNEGRLWARYACDGTFVAVGKHTSLYRVPIAAAQGSPGGAARP